jgi:PleD family two-component response regulator
MTISVGIGTIVPSADDDLTRFLDEVDRCLYRAKQSGRNRVIARK